MNYAVFVTTEVFASFFEDSSRPPSMCSGDIIFTEVLGFFVASLAFCLNYFYICGEVSNLVCNTLAPSVNAHKKIVSTVEEYTHLTESLCDLLLSNMSAYCSRNYHFGTYEEKCRCRSQLTWLAGFHLFQCGGSIIGWWALQVAFTGRDMPVLSEGEKKEWLPSNWKGKLLLPLPPLHKF